MTEKPLQISTQGATSIQTGFNSAASISANDAHALPEPVDEEPYTIKCICNFDEDDGNTIYCETCDTWQHIECFYPGQVTDASRPDFDHSCADCKPRPLDRRHAIDHQQNRQNKSHNDSSDKKSKRPPTKSHKKKPKPSDLQVNGYHDQDGRRNPSPQDHHPKKAKGHRSNQSISSQVKRSPPYNPRPQSHGHPPSPVHTPPDLPSDFHFHSYSDHFLTLYDNDSNVQITNTNSFASLWVTNSLSSWLHDSEKLREDAGVTNREDVFQALKVSPDSLNWPVLNVVSHKDTKFDGITLHWKSLVMPIQREKAETPLGELNGLVGFQKDYCNDVDNRWQEYVHPKPFIFFHPRLPLFIDTRKEGSECRYVRRSCRPNTALETFTANKSEYHFWLVNDRPLRANEQITIPWDFRFPTHSRSRYLHLLNLGDEDGAPLDGAATEITEEEYQQLSNMIDLVLSDFGGCACDFGSNCSFARFHRNYHGRSHSQSNGVKSKKGRKPKQTHISPTSTGQATNSRAASEGQQEQYDEDDRRSVSGSGRSKPNSRDMTPLHGVAEGNGIQTEFSDREKRKIAMMEESFKKMEDKQGQPARKKKRASDGSTTITTSSTTKPRQKSVAPRMSISQAHPPSLNGSRSRQYVDASTSRRQSGSPSSAISPTQVIQFPEGPASRHGSVPLKPGSRQSSTTPRGNYTDSCTQTDSVENTWYSNSKQSPPIKRSIIPLSKRLLKNRQNLRQKQDLQVHQIASALNHQSVGNSPSGSIDVDMTGIEDRYHPDSPTEARGRRGSIASSTPSVDIAGPPDIVMAEAPTIAGHHLKKPPPPPWPAPIVGSHGTFGQKSPDLRDQMPPTPAFVTPNLSGAVSGSVTPSSAAGSIAQSPFGMPHILSSFPLNAVNGVALASPIKTTKKLSLSDYNKLKMNAKKTDTAKHSGGNSPTVTPASLKPPLSAIEETKGMVILEGSGIIDSPILEKKMDPMNAVNSNTEPVVPDPSPSRQQNGTL